MEEKSFKRGANLAAKLDKISENFDIAESCADGLAEVLEEQYPMDVLAEVVDDEENDIDLINVKYLRKDFSTIRAILLDTIEKGRIVISNLTDEMLATEDGTKAGVISAYSELVATVNNSAKLLITTYKEVAEVQQKLIDRENKTDVALLGTPGVVNIQQNNIVMNKSTSDLIKELTQGANLVQN